MSNTLEGLIIIGGAEDKKGEKKILQEVCAHIEKESQLLVIVTVATQLPIEVGNEYSNIFYKLGIKNLRVLDVANRQDALKSENVELIEKASLVFFTGGDQLRITSILGGTPLYSTMKHKYSDGCVFVGTSAGASVMSDTMIVKGIDDESPKKCTLKMAPGLGLIKGVIIDQHFAQRGRVGRLLIGVAENPEVLGIGIDEDTSIIVNRENILRVLGSGAVYIIDGSNISDTNVSEQYQDNILSIFNVTMHVLKTGDKYNLKTRTPFI
ncbi:cyanophycinase [Clostridium psychrophilum]|uniref:cyanophycinase n=1 Tax=Clostridium psychrophilum TaxID=132926 RepID=UPI001C0CC67C|nr:cyanophycinase [Clostridium psychrophilum]MBU3181097.1 cyanophycinase [Clostridium psychrophilum]